MRGQSGGCLHGLGCHCGDGWLAGDTRMPSGVLSWAVAIQRIHMHKITVHLGPVPFTVCKWNLIENDKENVQWFPIFLHSDLCPTVVPFYLFPIPNHAMLLHWTSSMFYTAYEFSNYTDACLIEILNILFLSPSWKPWLKITALKYVYLLAQKRIIASQDCISLLWDRGRQED